MKNCSLCGGRLDHNKRCTFCGLDNSKNDDMYKHLLNQNECEHRPLTHIHEEPTRTTMTKKNGKKNSASVMVAVIACILALAGTLIPLIEEVSYDPYEDFYEEVYEEAYVDEDYDPYEYVETVMPEEGEVYKVELTPGIYKVGTQLPAGFYEAEIVTGDCGYITIDDHNNWIYFTEDIGFDYQETVYDLRLYEGAFFTVSSNVKICMYTENAQPLTDEAQQNPLTETVVVTNYATAGTDFEAGIYDIVYQPTDDYEYGYVAYMITDEYGEEYRWDISFDSENGAETFHNVALPEGAELYVEDLGSITLVPSETIYTTDYNEFYQHYY